MWINQKKMSFVQLRVELLMCLSQRKNWAWTQCETQHLPGLRHPNKDKNSNLHVIRDAPTELWNASVSGGSLGPVTQLRTGTSSSTSASGSSTDMMPINETAKSTNETGIEILCQTVLRRLHLQADVRWQRQVWTGEEMDTWQTTVWSNFIKRKKKICIQKMEEKREGIPQKTSEDLSETNPQRHLWSKLYSLMKNAGLPAEINSSVMKKSMWRPLSSQLQSVQALLPTQCMLGAHFVGHLCSRDVNLGVLSGALSCPKIKTQSFLTWRKLQKLHTFYSGLQWQS